MMCSVRGCLDSEDGTSVRKQICLCAVTIRQVSIAFQGFMSPPGLMHVVTSCRAAESGNFGGRAKASCRVGFRGRGRGRDAGCGTPPAAMSLLLFARGGGGGGCFLN